MDASARTHGASSSMSRCTYHVFLNFRGVDTCKNFTDYLYTALMEAGIHTFRDDDEIERGENIETELQKAIKESKVSIIVFSRDYASSRWCLNELVKIMERRRTVGHIVVPVFYDVDPSHVRKQTGTFAEAFARHEMQFKEEMDMVEMWRAALTEVANLAGMALKNRHEWQFIQDIVREIGKKLYRPVLNVAPHLVGIDFRVKEINLWLQDGSNDVGIATIFGIGGIGKTTIAKTVYNQNFERFQGRSFLANIRDTSKDPIDLVRLQNQLLSDLLKGKMDKVYNVDEGIMKIKDAIYCRKVLIVLDDVDQLDQLDAIIGMREWLYPGSKIIITTRHERLLKAYEMCVKFKVKEMDDNESLQLLSWQAFGQSHPTEAYMECSRKAVHQCGGLPLALQVLSSSLSGKCINEWESALCKLEAILDSKIQSVLRISYDSLQDDHDKNLFLDIACFFIGKYKDYTVGILDGCDFYTTVGIQNLIDRCLLTVNEEGKLMMHQLLRDMGREIIRQESTDDPGKRSRLWHHTDAFDVLKEKTCTETIKGLALDLRKSMNDKRGKKIVGVNFAKRHLDEYSLDKSTIRNCSKRRRLGFFSWQPMNNASANSLPLSNEAGLETKTFMKMHKLKLLQLNYVKLSGDYKDFSKKLIWLCWHGCPLKSIPTNFYLEKLVALDMRYSSLKHVWRGIKFLTELKFLNLGHSHSLSRTPDFSGLLGLERLSFKDCINLVKVDESIGELKRLVFFNLKDCKNLTKLPRKIGLLKSLEEFILSGCSKLDNLPEDLGKMESLKVLHVDGIVMNQLLSTNRDTKILSLLSTAFWHSTFWSWLSPRNSPRSSSFSLAFLPYSLTWLSVEDCSLSGDTILNDLSILPSLKLLNLSGNPLHDLPGSISSLTLLEALALNRCTGLRSLPELPMSLVELDASDCTSLERVPNLPNLSTIYNLAFSGCGKLVEVQGLFKLEPIRNIDITVMKRLGLSNLESLESIEVNLLNTITLEKRKNPLQVLHECGVLSIFLPGTEVPRCFSHQSMGSSISFDVPPLSGHKIYSLNLCTLYALRRDPGYSTSDPHCAKIDNKTKHMKWTYNPICYATPDAEEKDMLWLSHWKFGDQLEGGDQIDVSVVMPPGFQVKMCGICLVYEPEDKSNTEEIFLSTSPWYQTLSLTEAGYFRCHHSFASHQLKIINGPDELCEYDYLFKQNSPLELETCIICEEA